MQDTNKIPQTLILLTINQLIINSKAVNQTDLLIIIRIILRVTS